MTRDLGRGSRLRDRLRTLFTRGRSITKDESTKFREEHWEAEDYSGSPVADPFAKDPWETDPHHWDSTYSSEGISEIRGSPASPVEGSTDGHRYRSSVLLAVRPPPVALKEARSIEAPAEARNQPFTLDDLPAAPPEIGLRKPNTSVAAEENLDPRPAAALASDNGQPDLPKLSDAGTVKADRPREPSIPDEEPKHEVLPGGDDLETADDAWGDDRLPQDEFEEETFAETIEGIDQALKGEAADLDAGAIEEFFDYDADARQRPWGDGEGADEDGDDGIRRAREKAAAIASIVEVMSRRERETLLEWLTEFFLEFRHPATFRAIAGVIDQNVTADLLRAVIALRRYWMERPEWWFSRSDLRRESYPIRKGSKGLGWALALRVCRCRRDYAPEDMIDEGWFDEWLALPRQTPSWGERGERTGRRYFVFAEYVNDKVSDPESQLLHEGLLCGELSEGYAEMGDDWGWWRTLPRYDESIRFGFSVLTPFRDGFGPLGYLETKD
jgi:hypothetical protein